MLYMAGTRGGAVRKKILKTLEEKPQNINELSKRLSLDYKSVQHHMRVMERIQLVSSRKKKYGNEYEISPLMKAYKHIFKELDAYGKK